MNITFFGKGDTTGLLDCDEDDYEPTLRLLKETLWKQILGDQTENFIKYFDKYKSQSIKSGMLKSVGKSVNIYGPWYSNAAESMNHQFKSLMSSEIIDH